MPIPVATTSQSSSSRQTRALARGRRYLPSAGHWSARRLDVLLQLLERRDLTANELRVLLAVVDRERPLSELGPLLGRPPAEVRRTAARLRLDGMLRQSGSAPAFAITPRGLAALKPLMTAVGGRRT